MKTRIISAIVMLAIFVPLIIIGGLVFEIGIAVLSLLAFREIIKLYEKEKKVPLVIKVLAFISVGLLVMSYESLLPCIALILLFCFMPIIFTDNKEYNINNAASLFGIIMFIGIPFYTMNIIRMSSIEEFIYLISITIFTDTFAYVGGRLLGKHKLMPKVSPNKTLEGSIIGSMMGTLVPCFIYLFYVRPDINIAVLIGMTLIISLLAQLGDLLFSSIKRNYNTKDFSNIIPGHGGILDRFDSLLVASLVYTIIILLFL